MKFNFSGSDFKSRVLECEIEVSLYDRLSEPGEELPDKIKVAILIENAPMKLRDASQCRQIPTLCRCALSDYVLLVNAQVLHAVN